MIKLAENKYGSVIIEEKNLKKLVDDLVHSFVSKKDHVSTKIKIKKNSLEKVDVTFKKKCNLSVVDQKNLQSQIDFILSTNFGINNSFIIFYFQD